ncbi:MAG: hypothetical protein ACRDPA_27550 [Solirubrobacteraceae bacterium]
MTGTPMFGRMFASLSVALMVALGAAGCGPTPPQAPLAQAKKLDSATGDIATACGLTYQVTAFPGDHSAELADLEGSATSSARKLASVYAGNPAWIYQGATVGKIVHDAVAMLRACGLRDAAGALSVAASGRASGTAP